MKKLVILFCAMGLTLLVGVKTFAAPAVNTDLTLNSGVTAQGATSNGFSGSIDLYHPDYTPSQSQSDLRLNLNYGPGDGPHDHGGPGPRMGYGPPPELWIYTLIGIVVVEVLARD